MNVNVNVNVNGNGNGNKMASVIENRTVWSDVGVRCECFISNIEDYN